MSIVHNLKVQRNMIILLIKANPKLYEAKGGLNADLFSTSSDLFLAKHTILTSDIADGKWNITREIDKLKQADLIIYHFPVWWFGVPSILKRYFDEVLVHKETFVMTDGYGEGGQLVGKKFMLVVTSNMKKSDLGTSVLLKEYSNIDEILTQVILTNKYIGIQEQLTTFHADDVIQGDVTNVIDSYRSHLQALSI